MIRKEGYWFDEDLLAYDPPKGGGAPGRVRFGYWLIRYRLSGLPLKDWRSVAKPRDVGFGRFVHSLAHLFVIDEPTPLRYPSKILELPINY